MSDAPYPCPSCGGRCEVEVSTGRRLSHVDARNPEAICLGPKPLSERERLRRRICPACFQWLTPTADGRFRFHRGVDNRDCRGSGRPAIAVHSFEDPMWAETVFEAWDESDAEAWAKRADEEEALREAAEARAAEEAAAEEARLAREAAARRAEHLQRIAARSAAAVAGVNTEYEVSCDSRDSARTYELLVDIRELGRFPDVVKEGLLSQRAESWERRRGFWEAREQDLLRLKGLGNPIDEGEIVAAIQSAEFCRQIRESVLYVKDQLKGPHQSREGNSSPDGNPSPSPKEATVDRESFFSRLWRKFTDW
jgi:hypothetical protein